MTPPAVVWNREGTFRSPVFVNSIRSRRTWEYSRQPVLTLSAPSGILSKLASRVLGQNGVTRVLDFLSYPDGWDFGRGRALCTDSIQQMELFFEKFADFRCTPSIFLTPAGNLLLGWEDAFGESIELEFTPDAFVLFLAGPDTEHTYRTDQIDELLYSLKTLPQELSANGSA